MAAKETPLCEFGKPAPDFRLRGVDSREWTLADCCGTRTTLIMFICNHCPYVKACIDRIVAVCNELVPLGMQAGAIMPNDVGTYPEDSFENMQRFAQAHKFPFPYLYDETQQVARAYGALCTPDFFGYNASSNSSTAAAWTKAAPRGRGPAPSGNYSMPCGRSSRRVRGPKSRFRASAVP